MQTIQLGETVAARRRIRVVLLDATDKETGETGITLSAGDLKLSKAGGAEANHAGTLTELAGGDYYYEATAGECDTLGILHGRLTKAGCMTYRFAVLITAPARERWVGTLAGIAAGSVTLASGHGLHTHSLIKVSLVAGTNAVGRERFATHASGDQWTVDPAWDADGETVPSGTIVAVVEAVPRDPTTNRVQVDVVEVNGTAVPSSAGRAEVNTTHVAGTAQTAADVGVLPGRLTAPRAGYLDNLNVGGLVASSAEVSGIQNNTRVARVVPSVLERPDAGSTAYRIELTIYDSNGNMEAPDSAPTLDVVNQGGTSRNGNLDSTTGALVSTGRYRWTYTVAAAHALEQLVYAFSVVEGGATRIYVNPSLVVDTMAVDFTASDRTQLQELHAKLPSKPYFAGTANSTGDVQANDMTGTPADPAGVTTLLDVRLTAPRAAALDNLDAAVSSRAAPGAAMTLTVGERTAIAVALFATTFEGGRTLTGFLRLVSSVLWGKSSGHAAGTGTRIYRDQGDTKPRITADTDANGNRTAVTVDDT